MSTKLKFRRQNAGLTQVQIANKAGITERGYRKYEASDKAKSRSVPDVLTAIKIADALGVQDLRELWGKTSQQT